MANWYVSSASYAAVTAWSAGGTMTVGTLRRPTAPAVGNERVFRCTTAGTGGVSGGSQPSWPTTQGGTVADNGGVWTEVTGQEAFQGPVASAWTAPHARLENAYNWATGADVVFVSNTHSQTQASAWSPTNVARFTYCVTETTVPATDANRTTGAVIATSGDNGIAPSLADFFQRSWMEGIKFRTGVGASSGTNSVLVNPKQAHNGQIFKNCDFEHAATHALADAIQLGCATSGIFAHFIDCSIKFGNVGSNLNITGAAWFREGARGTFLQGSTIPTVPIKSGGAPAFFDRLDLSNINTTLTDYTSAYNGSPTAFRNCKLHASVTVTLGVVGRTQSIDLINSDSTLNYRHERYTVFGTNVISTGVVRTGGASENSVPLSWKVTTNASATFVMHHWTFPLPIYNSTVGSSVNVTVEGIADPTSFSALPKNDEVWIDVSYNSDTGGTGLATLVEGSKASFLATAAALTASTQAWDTAATARANSTAYSLGDIRKVASNPGRLFVCTTAGTSAGSEPGGYASAVDGGAVTDGSAVFTAMWRFKQTIAVTPRQVGYINVQPKMAKASAVVYIDPLIVLS